METTIAYWWIVKLVILALSIYLLSKAYKESTKTKVFFNKWMRASMVIFTISLINPIKVDGTNSVHTVQHVNSAIELSKELPEKVVDDSFKTSVEAPMSITNEELK